MSEYMFDPKVLAFVVGSILTCVLGVFLALVIQRINRKFRDGILLLNLHRDNEAEIRERLASRLGDLEDRVARLEDPSGKRKRGGAIYDFDRREAIPGLSAFEDYRELPIVSTAGDNQPARVQFVYSPDLQCYILGDDGELRKDNAHD